MVLATCICEKVKTEGCMFNEVETSDCEREEADWWVMGEASVQGWVHLWTFRGKYCLPEKTYARACCWWQGSLFNVNLLQDFFLFSWGRGGAFGSLRQQREHFTNPISDISANNIQLSLQLSQEGHCWRWSRGGVSGKRVTPRLYSRPLVDQ